MGSSGSKARAGFAEGLAEAFTRGFADTGRAIAGLADGFSVAGLADGFSVAGLADGFSAAGLEDGFSFVGPVEVFSRTAGFVGFAVCDGGLAADGVFALEVAVSRVDSDSAVGAVTSDVPGSLVRLGVSGGGTTSGPRVSRAPKR